MSTSMVAKTRNLRRSRSLTVTPTTTKRSCLPVINARKCAARCVSQCMRDTPKPSSKTLSSIPIMRTSNKCHSRRSKSRAQCTRAATSSSLLPHSPYLTPVKRARYNQLSKRLSSSNQILKFTTPMKPLPKIECRLN